MARIFLICILNALLASSLSAVRIDSAYTRYYKDSEIRTIGGYFGSGLTGQGYRSVVASQSQNPEGQYFITKLSAINEGNLASARMTYYLTSSKDSFVHQWDLSKAVTRNWLYLGMTGSDWPDEDVRPLAWKIELLSPDGSVLAEWKSFLWEMP